MNLNAIIMAEKNNDFDNNLNQLKSAEMNSLENMDLDESEKAVEDQIGANFNSLGEIYNGDKLPPEKINEIMANMKESNIGYIFNSENTKDTTLSPPQPLAPLPSTPPENRKVNNNYGTDSQAQPSLAIGPTTGNIYITWLDDRDPYLSKIYFARSRDDGKSFDAFTYMNKYPNTTLHKPTIAVDSSENIFVVWSDDRTGVSQFGLEDFNYDVWLNKSTDQGDSWLTADVRVNSAIAYNQTHPSIAIDDNDVIYVAWEDAQWSKANGKPFDFCGIYVANSSNSGNSFYSRRKIYEDISKNVDGQNPAITVDENNYLWVVWSDNRTLPSDLDVYFSRTKQPWTGGVAPTFNTSSIVHSTQDSTDQIYPDIAVINEKKAYVVWQDERSGFSSDIYFAKYSTSTASFANEYRLNNDPGDKTQQKYPKITVNSNNNHVYVNWMDERNGYYQNYIAKSVNNGGSFSLQKAIDDEFSNLNRGVLTSLAPNPTKSIAVHTNNTIYVVYAEDRYGNYDIFFQKSADLGNSWTESVMVNDNDTESYQGISNKYEIAIGPDRAVHVVWAESREDFGKLPYETGDIYYAKSYNSGLTFTPGIRVNNKDAGAMKNPAIAVNESNWVFITWTDASPGSDNINFAWSSNGGQSFEPTGPTDRQVSGATVDNDYSDIAVNATGTVFITYIGEPINDPVDSIEDPDTWVAFAEYSGIPAFDFSGNDVKLNDDNTLTTVDQFSPSIAINPINDYIYVVWQDARSSPDTMEIYFANSTNSGTSYSTNKRVDLSSGLGSNNVKPAVAVNASGNISIVWEKERSTHNDIRYAKSINHGVTFTAYKWVNSVSTGNQESPTIAIDDKYIYVAWQDSQNGNYDIYMAKSEDNGSTFKGDIRVDDDSSKLKQLNPSIAVLTNLTDNVFIVWSDRRNNIHRQTTLYDNNYDVYIASSMDNGLSFSKSYNIEIHQTEPDIEVDDNGIVYAVWTDYTFGYWGDITFSKSYSGGQYFNTTTIISDDTTNLGRGKVDMVVKNGVIYVVWEDATGDPFNSEIIFSKSTDGGQSFSTPANITNGNNYLELKPALAIDRNNKLHVVWEDNSLGGAWNIFYANSTDGGSTWSSSTRVNPPMLANEYFDPDIAINYSSSTPEIYVVYVNVSLTDPGDISFTLSTDGGNTFLSDHNVTDDGGVAAQFNPAIDVDSKGNAYIVWEDDRSAGDWDIYFSKTTTYGINFSLNIQVNISTGDEYNPDIRIDPSNDNNVMVIWESDVGTGPDFNFNIYNATSIDGGTTFLAANRVDDTGSEIQHQEKAKLAVDSHGSIHAIWGDYRSGNGDIYNAIIMDNTPPIANAGPPQTTSQADYGHFLAAGSKDNYGIDNYTWTFNDGGPKTVYGYNAKYIFNTPGSYIITLTVTDYFGNIDTDTFTLTVSDLTPPVLSNDQTTPPATTGDPFTFKIDVTDFQLRTVKPVFVEYQIGPTGQVKNESMTAGTGDQFIYTIPFPHVPDILTSIYYNFSAVDEQLNWNRFTVGISNPIPILDNDEPQYGSDSTPITATTGDPFTFTIICTDNIDVETSKVGYRYGSSGAFTEFDMTEGTANTYSYTITRIDDTLTPLEYYFNFNDTSDNWNQSSTSVVTIVDNDLPEFLLDNSDTAAYAGSDFAFSLQFKDNIDTDSAHVVYTFSSTRTRAIKTLTQSGTDWITTVTVPQMLGKLRYTFHFNDTSQNTNQSSETVLDIQDNTVPSSVSGSGDIATTTGEGFKIFAKFEDNIGIDTVTVHYLKEGTTSWQSKAVTLGTDGNYTITNSGMEINTSTDDKNWNYYFFAKDASDNNITYGSKTTPYTITVTDNDPPVADAGADITADKGDTVNFVGTGSSDNIGVTNYKWTFMYDGSKETLTTATTSFKFEISGFYDVTLNVTDDAGNWDTDVVRVRILSDVTKPDVKLQDPINGKKLKVTTVILHWTTTHADANLVTYDVYVGITPNNLEKKTTTAQGVTEYELTGLEDGQTYYWQVQPKLGDLVGDKSDTWSFTIDLGLVEIYDVDIVADTTTVIIVVGNSKEVTLTVTNNGNVDDVIQLTMDKKNFPDSIVLSQETLVLTPGQSLDVTLTINTLESTPISNFNIIITATSQSATEDVSDSVTIKITTIEKPTGVDEDEDNLPDDWEIKYFGSIDKYSAEDDPDADGYSNLEEYLGDMDPTKKDVAPTEDTDGDNLPDTWEIEHFGDIQKYGKNDDPDKDGKSNYQEYLDGTNPLDKKEKEDEKGEDNTMLYAGVAVAVIVIIIVLLLLFMMMKKKKGGETTEQPPEQQQVKGPTAGPGATPPPPSTGIGGGPGDLGGGPGVGPGPGPDKGPGMGGGGPGQAPGSGLIQ